MLNRWIARLAVPIAVAVVASLLGASPAVANDSADSPGSPAQKQPGGASSLHWNVEGLTSDVIAQYSKYVERTESGFVAHIPDALKQSHPDEVAAVTTAIQKANQSLQRLSTNRMGASGGSARLSTSGFNYLDDNMWFHVDWWGVTLELDQYATNVLLGLIGVGVGVATIAGAITAATAAGPVIAGVIAGFLVVSAGVISICAAGPGGVDIHKSYVTGAIWCTSQG